MRERRREGRREGKEGENEGAREDHDNMRRRISHRGNRKE
jgi:hypothetical protein